MIFIKKSEKTKKKFNFFNKFLYFYFFSTIIISFIFLVFFFTSSFVNKKTYKFLDHFSKAGRFEYIYIFNIAFDAIKSNFYSIKKINLDIDFKDILILENHRSKSIKAGTLGNSDNIPQVKGNAVTENGRFEIDIRLKGERKIHFNDKISSSYKVDLNKDSYIFGLNSFSLQKPRVRNYIHEWLFHEMAGDFDLVKMKYEFIDLAINGSNQGLYVVEESFGKEMIERNKRRNGPIFALDDNMVNFISNYKVDEDNPFLEIYDKKFWLQKENILVVKSASQKLRDFTNNKKTLEQTFDLDKFAKFFAIIDATYTFHALSPGTLRLYYNPVSGLFEPIPFDGQRSVPNYSKFNTDFNSDQNNSLLIDYINKGGWWIDKFFLKGNKINEIFYNKYVDNLKIISSEDYLNKFFKDRKSQIKRINSFIYSDYFYYANGTNFGPGIYYFKKKDLFYRAEIIRKRISSLNKNVQIIKNENGNYLIKIFFKNCFKCKPYTNLTKIFVKNAICSKKSYEKINIPVGKQLDYKEDTIIKLNHNFNQINCTHFTFYDSQTDKIFTKKVNDLNSYQKLDNEKYFENEKFKKYFNSANNILTLKKNTITIDENIFIPENYLVKIFKDQEIILINNAFIFSNSSWQAIGEKNKEILITGNKNNFGGGLIIKETRGRSDFKYVRFKFLNGLKKSFYSDKEEILYTSQTYYLEGDKNNFKERIIEKNNKPIYDYNLMGSINFFNTNLKLENVNFEKISSEDAINIINSNFYIKDINFLETGSDSIDFDFSEGIIENANFSHIGNDAIDFSGSKVTLKNANFFSVGDKAISVGENSEVKISNIFARKSYVGIAAKDGSNVLAKNIIMDGVKIPFSSFIKKFEYDNPTLHLEGLDIKNYHEKWIVDKKSNIYFDNIKVGKIAKDIIPIIYRKDIELIK
ncbi:MAG: hypothetical protein CBC25_00660 [Pelagibacteraceae bacterium TMED65]|nr:MAG: hypothetical protein CBC25_00660 [Pelagibacteraceae bacterium TMED65]|tara:strand:+ start:1917 stop:4676 length:2760 start_codon:yes stop_codon:yes gene_type:complete